MAQSYECELEQSVVRQRNRVLNITNRKIREAHRELSDKTDELVRAFCETETESERAMRELWERGGLDCSPQDYEGIVERCVAALQFIEALHELHGPF